jgi:hypothetical protein
LSTGAESLAQSDVVWAKAGMEAVAAIKVRAKRIMGILRTG